MPSTLFTARTLGLWFLLGYALSQGMRDVYLSGAFGSIGFFDLVFLAFSGATVFFTLCVAAANPSDFKRLRREWRPLLLVNVTTASAWLCYFGALNLIEPSVVATVFAGVSPAGVALLAMLGLKAADGAAATRPERMAHIGILVAMAFLAWVVLSGRSGTVGLSLADGLAGLLLATASGLSITAETVLAKRMNETGISPTGVLALRFVLVALIGAFAVFGLEETSMNNMAASEIGLTTLKIMVLMVAPLYLVGKGLALTSPLTTGVVAAFGPTVVFLMQAAEGRIPTSYWVLAATLGYVAITCTSLIMRTGFPVRKQLGKRAFE